MRSERTDRLHRVTPGGELDIATVPALEREFDAAPALDGDTTIVVDLTQLSFMDSTGINLLLRLKDRFGDRLRVVNGSPAVTRLFDLAGVRGLLPVISRDDDPLEPLAPAKR